MRYIPPSHIFYYKPSLLARFVDENNLMKYILTDLIRQYGIEGEVSLGGSEFSCEKEISGIIYKQDGFYRVEIYFLNPNLQKNSILPKTRKHPTLSELIDYWLNKK